MQGFPLLSFLTWLPIAGGLLVLAFGERGIRAGRWVALGIAVATFVASIPLYCGFDTSSFAYQFREHLPWIPAFHATYSLGVDGISMPLILLTTFITIPGGRRGVDRDRTASRAVLRRLPHHGRPDDRRVLRARRPAVLLLLGSHAHPDVPHHRRVGRSAARVRHVKFFLYTFLGSVFMLVALIYMLMKSGDFSIAAFHALPLSATEQMWIFFAFLAAFAVKIPMVPVHTWLPDAHVEAPTGGSVVLAAIMLKMGGYGFLRFTLPITPDASREFDWLLIALSLIAVVYIGFVALVQTDMKKLIAYSSIAHMGFVTLGSFLVYDIIAGTGAVQGAGMGIDGAMVQMISHGLISGALFLCVGVMYDRVHSREISAYGGVVNTMPKFAAFMVLFSLANAGLPGTSGFVGEFLVIIAAFKANFWYAFLAAVTLILGAAYTLWLVKRVIFGEVANHHVAELQDLNFREFTILGLLAVAVLAVGLWPAPLLEVMQATVQHLVQQIAASKLPL